MAQPPTLTTQFTPPSSCLATSAFYQIWTSVCASPLITCDMELFGVPDITGCFPPGYTPSLDFYYSPGVCPSGYTPACTSFNTVSSLIETIYTCCPTYGSH